MAGTRIASVSGLRGIVGDGLDPAVLAEFAAAYAGTCGPGPILIGHDGRASAPALVPAVVAGVAGAGHDVWIAGPTATPTVGVLVTHHRLSGAIQVSASHNPPEYNGLKFFQPGGMVLSPSQGRTVLDRFERRDLGWARWDRLGAIRDDAPGDDCHLDRLEAIVDARAIARAGFRVVLDACHGAGSRLGVRLLGRWCRDAIVLGGTPDGRYDHPPEPTEENLGGLAAAVTGAGAAVGFAQDPDADRLAIVDETGRYIGEELTLALAARHRLSRGRGPLVLNLSTSRVAEEIALARGCPVVRTPVGEIHVVEGMRAHDAILGGEGNGGVIDPRVGFVRDSFAAMALVLDLMAASGEPLSRLVDALPRAAMVKAKVAIGGTIDPALLDRIAEAHPEARADRRDGLRLDWPNGWAHVRASNTEPIVRIIAEAPERGRARDLVDLLARRLGGAGPVP